MTRKDLLTGEEFTVQRINQKFANPQNRIKYYNNKANQLRYKNAYINKPLHSSVCILNELLADTKAAVFHKQYLLGKGLSFNVFTHYEIFEGKRQCAVYQYIIVPLDNEQIKIVKK